MSKARVIRVLLLDGKPVNAVGHPMTPDVWWRNVYQRKDGSHYIVELGSRTDVTALPDGTFVFLVEARSVSGGIAV